MYKSLAALIFLLASLTVAFPQSDPLVKGDQLYEKKDYQNALVAYYQALRVAKNDPLILFKIGYTYLQTETKGLASSFLEKAYKLDPQIDPKIVYYLGVAYQSNLQFAKAKRIFEQYKKFVSKKEWPELDQRIQQCILSHVLVSFPVDVLIENAGTGVNSTHDDYGPIVSADGMTMIFTSNRTKDTLKTNPGYEDIYISQMVNDEWAAPKKISNEINMGHHDAAASLSPDGKTLFLYYDMHYGDIYTSKLKADGTWAKPTPLNSNVNSAMFRETSASVSADGQKLYFSSTRPGGKGNMDIYMSTLDAKGQWGKPVPLGDPVNTWGNEDSPYIHPDGVTLYFSSDGHPGMGSSDIFKTILKDGKWQKPENLGFPINSIEYDGFFNISEDKRTAYFATLRKYGIGGYEILKATFRSVAEKPVIAKVEPIKTNTTTVVKEPVKEKVNPYLIKGKAIDKKTKKPMVVAISIVNVNTKKLLASIQSSPTGDYEFQIPQNGSYVLTAESQGYLFNTINFQVPQTSSEKLLTDFIMEKAELGSVMVLKNILFETGKSELKPATIQELEKVRKLLLANPNLKVQINGHTDNIGDPVENKTLSLKRALAVVNHLALNGIDFDRLSAKGYGSEKPVASNDDEKDGREVNRRTEIEILDVNLVKEKI